jgi:arginase
MNTPETSPSGNIHGMRLAVVLGIGEKSLVRLAGDEGPMVEGARAAVVGLRDVDPAEKENIRESGIGAFTMRDIDERGMRAVMEEAIKRATSGTAGMHISFDLDSTATTPGVARRRRAGSAIARRTWRWRCCRHGQVSAEFVEVNPILITGTPRPSWA